MTWNRVGRAIGKAVARRYGKTLGTVELANASAEVARRVGAQFPRLSRPVAAGFRRQQYNESLLRAMRMTPSMVMRETEDFYPLFRDGQVLSGFLHGAQEIAATTPGRLAALGRTDAAALMDLSSQGGVNIPRIVNETMKERFKRRMRITRLLEKSLDQYRTKGPVRK